MNYFWITLRGFAFWLGAFYAFTLAWSPLELSTLSGAMMLAPVCALVFGAVLPDKALLDTPQMRIVLGVVLTVGVVGCVVAAIDDFTYRNMVGVWFRILTLVMIASLYARAIFVRASRPAGSVEDARKSQEPSTR
jgi:Kef-type K+ transport system membrane component KefB